jgi:malate dehydrogenase (oxaloacetate-decarboxylating)(NADP+)
MPHAITKEKALAYHKHAPYRHGKIGIDLVTECDTQHDLSLAYTPGVGYPCVEISQTPERVYDYTNKGNLVAVISDGSAVLGLGNIGPAASKPVMEGKSVLFKKFADVDAFDIELGVHTVDEIITACQAIAPTFGGINLEDIAAPQCFEIETRLQEALDIPVFHDDQHGTAIITTAALINVLDLTNKQIEQIKIVINGAGAAGISCAKMYRALGAKQIILCDSHGVIHADRNDLNPYKKEFAVQTEARTLADAMMGADMFLGLSVAGAVTGEMVASMVSEPVIFACANPIPEIFPHEVHAVRDDAIVGTGRSDFPNQTNNVLGFPFIFRGALDVRARKITEGMKMAAARALAELAKEPVPYYVKAAYSDENLAYGKEHVIPKPFNKEALIWVASAVAQAAVEEGVARIAYYDHATYRKRLRDTIYGTREEEQ